MRPDVYKTGLSKIAAALICAAASACTANQTDLGVGLTPTPAEVAAAKPVAADTEPTQVANAAAPADPAAAQADPVAATTTALIDPASQANPANAAVAATRPEQQPAAARTRIRFLPVTGVPQSKAGTLANAISRKAEASNLAIVPGSGAASYQIKGYLSALNEGTATTVTFYWDVLDPAGKRIYRVNGFEQVSRVSTDPWRAVDDATIQKIAGRTIDGLNAFLARRAG